jgi:hypothetical protein
MLSKKKHDDAQSPKNSLMKVKNQTTKSPKKVKNKPSKHPKEAFVNESLQKLPEVNSPEKNVQVQF